MPLRCNNAIITGPSVSVGCTRPNAPSFLPTADRLASTTTTSFTGYAPCLIVEGAYLNGRSLNWNQCIRRGARVACPFMEQMPWPTSEFACGASLSALGPHHAPERGAVERAERAERKPRMRTLFQFPELAVPCASASRYTGLGTPSAATVRWPPRPSECCRR